MKCWIFYKILPTDDCLLLVFFFKLIKTGIFLFVMCHDGLPGYFGKIVLNLKNCGLWWGVPYDDGLWIFFTVAEDEQKSLVLYYRDIDEEEDYDYGLNEMGLSLCN